jgi:hypothetical protein
LLLVGVVLRASVCGGCRISIFNDRTNQAFLHLRNGTKGNLALRCNARKCTAGRDYEGQGQRTAVEMPVYDGLYEQREHTLVLERKTMNPRHMVAF